MPLELVCVLASRIRDILSPAFSLVVDHGNEVDVISRVYQVERPETTRLRASYGIQITVAVPECDLAQAYGCKKTIASGLESWLAAIRGKNKVPIDMTLIGKELDHAQTGLFDNCAS